MTSFDSPSPKSKSTAAPPSKHDGHEPGNAPASPLHDHQTRQHRGRGHGHGAGASNGQHAVAHEQSMPASDTAAAGVDKLSEEASTRLAENAIKTSAEKPLFGGMQKQAKVEELFCSDPFEYLGLDNRSTSGFPNKTKTEA